ncbi:MAG: porin family protein [Chitinophagaceae bacterium]
MKSKMLLLLVITLSTTAMVFAQKTPMFQLGIKGGVNISKVDGKSFKDEFRYGYSLGGFAVVRVSEKFQIQPEVLFNQFNSKSGTNFDTLYNTDNLKDVKLNYLSVPILLNYSPVKFFTLQAGPQFGILLNKSDNLLTNGKNAFNSGDFSMVGGVQLNIANFKVSGRYFVGLSDIGDIDNKDKWKNQGFQLSVGLRIL